MNVDILILNVSSQCIPNLVAVHTFKPQKIVWVYTKMHKDILTRLKTTCAPITETQEEWLVDARDTGALHRVLVDKFTSISKNSEIMYLLTGGTKSMALQGMYNLVSFHRDNNNASVKGILINPRTQHFDIIYPRPTNKAFKCYSLKLGEMLKVHGNEFFPGHSQTILSDCAKNWNLWDYMQQNVKKFPFAIQNAKVLQQKIQDSENKWRYADDWRHFESSGSPFSDSSKKMLECLQSYGFLSELSFPLNNQVKYRQTQTDVLKLMNGDWLECWLGAVMHNSGIKWCGAGRSVKILEKNGGSQEFDFLGASPNNRLVYWSCKTDSSLKNDHLFEIDALRDGIAGRDFHCAGLLHIAKMTDEKTYNMKQKAKQLGLEIVNANDADSIQQIIDASTK